MVTKDKPVEAGNGRRAGYFGVAADERFLHSADPVNAGIGQHDRELDLTIGDPAVFPD